MLKALSGWSLTACTRQYGMIAFEWTLETLDEHQKQLDYLRALGYTEVAPQFIESHFDSPDRWYDIDIDLKTWQQRMPSIGKLRLEKE
jgi:hypothetical protein